MKALVISLLFFLGITSANAATEKLYQFGVFPYLSPLRMDKIYAPVSQQLTSILDRPVKFTTSSSHHKFLKKLKSGFFDFALVQPFWYPLAVDKYNYLPGVRMKEPFVSLIMTSDNSMYKSINDLKGTVIATPPANVPVVHLARQTLIENGITPGKDIQFAHFNSVDSCFQQVLIGKASACVTPPFATAAFANAMNIKLRVLLKSKALPNMSLVFNKRVSREIREKIQKEFSSWSSSGLGRTILKQIQTRGFIPVRDNEYDIIRELNQSLSPACCEHQHLGPGLH